MALLSSALVLTGCVAGDTHDDGGKPQRNLAVRPSSLAPVPQDTVAPSATASVPGGSHAPGASAGASTAPGTTGRPSASGAAVAPPFHQVGAAADRSGDAGATTPSYGDMIGVTVEDNGPNARVTVTMAGSVPAQLPSNETMGVGVDFYRSQTQLESDHQLFADGEPDGWYAYLQGPKGFVRYPGTFGLGGRRLVFTVPWTALGSPPAGYFSGFCDWTRKATPANLSGEDHAPDLTTAAYTR